MVSPPKPWEKAGSVASASSTSPAAAQSTNNATSRSNSTFNNDIAVPPRPTSLTNPPINSSNPYNSLSAYNSPYSALNSYNRFGSTYSPYGYGGGMYGGAGMGYGMNGMGFGMNGMYGGMGYPGMPMDPNAPSLTQQLESTTQQTFALLHSIVQTFTGLSQMLESTFMATHSSFFAMVGVVDQFSHLRNALGSVLGLFGLLRWLKNLIAGTSSSDPMRSEFFEFLKGRPVSGPSDVPTKKPSKKPLIIFLLAIFGIPYAMHKLVKAIAARTPSPVPTSSIDPSTITFARAKYTFSPASSVELALKENEIVAIMGKLDPATGLEVDPRTEVETNWWKGRTREGREGWFPSKWVEMLPRKSNDDPQIQNLKNVSS